MSTSAQITSLNMTLFAGIVRKRAHHHYSPLEEDTPHRLHHFNPRCSSLARCLLLATWAPWEPEAVSEEEEDSVTAVTAPTWWSQWRLLW